MKTVATFTVKSAILRCVKSASLPWIFQSLTLNSIIITPPHPPFHFPQSQVMRVIEANTDQFNLTRTQRSIYQKVDRQIADKEKEDIDYGIPWTTHDAFANLLQVTIYKKKIVSCEKCKCS